MQSESTLYFWSYLGVLVGKYVLCAVSDHVEHLVLAQVLLVLGQPPLLDHHPIQPQLHRRPLHDLLVDGVLGDHPEHLDLLLLTDSVRPIHGLQVHLRVPVGVKEDDDVGGVEIDAQSAGPRRQHEDELGRARSVVLLDLSVPVLVRRLAVDATVAVAAVPTVVLEDVKNSGHLREDEDARVLALQLGQQLVEDGQFLRVEDQVLVSGVRRS